MNVYLEGTVFEEPFTGVANVTLGLYAACAKLDPGIDIGVMHRRALASSLPPGMTGRRTGRFLPHSVWRRRWLPLTMKPSVDTVAHFPCNGMIPEIDRRLPVVMTLHDVIPLVLPHYFPDSEQEQAYRRRISADLERADLVITVSEYSKSEILRHFSPRTEPLVIHPGIAGLSDPDPGLPHPNGDRPYFIYVGGYDQRKGLDQLLRVFNELVATGGSSADLLIVGVPRSLSEEFDHLLNQGLETKRVHQTGYIDDDAVRHLLRNAIALIFPSKFEGFGLPALEAMAAGCPVVTTHSTSLPEVCGDAALYVDVGDDLTLAVAMQRLETSGDLRSAHIARGIEQSRRFDWQRSATKYLDALTSLVRNRP